MSKPNVVKEARQRQLIDATISTIGRRGFAGTTLTHVAGAAGMSPAIVNFYFKGKDQLLAATLAQLAEEYESFWMSAIAAAGGAPAAGLDAMVESDFHPAICTLEKVAVWFAFWAEAQSRPLYRSVVSELEERYLAQTRTLCEQLIAEGGYAGIDAADAAHGINALSDGLWADLLIDPAAFDHDGAKRICRMFLAAIFPQHFPLTEGRADAAGQAEAAVPTVTSFPATAEGAASRAHRERLAAALRRRLFPAATLQVADLAAQVGTDLATVLDWLEGKAEPTSSQLGRLLVGFDPAFLIELYGDDLAAMRQGFEQRLAAAREDERAGHAALATLTDPAS